MEQIGGADWWSRLVEQIGGADWWSRLVEQIGGADWWSRLVEQHSSPDCTLHTAVNHGLQYWNGGISHARCHT